jgi:hypothetical protein
MRAVQITRFGGPEVLDVDDVPLDAARPADCARIMAPGRADRIGLLRYRHPVE